MVTRVLVLFTVALVLAVGAPVGAAQTAAQPGAQTAAATAAPSGDWLLIWSVNYGAANTADLAKLFDAASADLTQKSPPGYLWHRFFLDESPKRAGFVSGWSRSPNLDALIQALPDTYSRFEQFFMANGLTEADTTTQVFHLLPAKPAADDAVKSAMLGLFSALSKMDVDGVLAYFTQDAVAVREQDGAEYPITGKEQLRQTLQDAIDVLAAGFATPPAVQVSVAGDTATATFDRTFTVRNTNSGDVTIATTWTATLKSAPAGWKISRIVMKVNSTKPS